MKRWCLVLVLLISVGITPAFSSEVVQMWYCEMDDDASEQWVRDHVAEWLEAAKQIEGGKKLDARVLFPVAVNSMGTFDVILLFTSPSFEEWGKFWDNYEGSAAADVETEDDEMLSCPNSALWEQFNVTTPGTS